MPLSWPDFSGRRVPLQLLRFDWLTEAALQAAVLRLDLLDPEVSGNKWYKLAGFLETARTSGSEGLISLGGPHSNHLHALAAAGQRAGLTTVGLLRGNPQTTPTIEDLERFGMQLHWLGYGGYRARHQSDFWDVWSERYPGYVQVPEGGGGLIGARGCALLVEQIRPQLALLGWDDYDAWWLACGTGTTLAGLVMGEAGRHPVYGALAGPGCHGVAAQVHALLDEAGVAHGGFHLREAARRGFGLLDDELGRFLLGAEAATGVPLEPVYTAKALWALRQEAMASGFAAGSRIVFVHTGGLQGRRASAQALAALTATADQPGQ